MYRVFEAEPEDRDIHIHYDADLDGGNVEWRHCVKDIVERLSRDFKIIECHVPLFERNEDFVELKYKIGEDDLKFSCDFLLNSIFIEISNSVLTSRVRNILGGQVGWAVI